jgi:cytochrome bd-type quinol oxidase subunit 2
MRWKLLLVTSSLAALAGAGASLGIAYGLTGGARLSIPHDDAALSVFALPLGVIAAVSVGVIVVASVFVYRHTARRRPLQAALTAALSAALTLGLVVVANTLLPRLTPRPQPHADRDSD